MRTFYELDVSGPMIFCHQMEIPFNFARYLHDKVNSVVLKLEDFDSTFTPEVHPADPRFGDFQANGILPFAKKIKKNPRELAEKLIKELLEEPLIKGGYLAAEIAGPGFINFKIQPKLSLAWMQKYKDKDDFKKESSTVYHNKTISIDYSSPNTAKQMHVGHIRSMVIGEAIQRLLRFHGARMIRDNHIGDWGTQFGIIIMAIKQTGYDLDAAHEDPLEDLENLYKQGNAEFEASDDAKERARQELVLLQNGDPENVNLWEKVNEVSYKEFQKIYDLMGVEFDVVHGESFYRDKVERVYKELEETKIATMSEGALVVFHPNPNPKVKPFPMIIRKKDGASNYATTDLATVLHHKEVYGVDEMVYVTDGRQQDHFKYLFDTVDLWFKAKEYKRPELKHAWFGTILGENGKAIKTRSGNPIKLKDLLNEAIERAYAIVSEKNPDLDEEEKKNIARVVGLGAIRYADLSQSRTSDYVFAWDKILAFDGNTAPYLLYAVARIHSIFRKLDISPEDNEEQASVFETAEEKALASKIIELPIILDQALSDLRPHILCTYLFELAGIFSSFYNSNKVITDCDKTKARRLILCSRTLRVLETGLNLLGLETLEKM